MGLFETASSGPPSDSCTMAVQPFEFSSIFINRFQSANLYIFFTICNSQTEAPLDRAPGRNGLYVCVVAPVVIRILVLLLLDLREVILLDLGGERSEPACPVDVDRRPYKSIGAQAGAA